MKFYTTVSFCLLLKVMAFGQFNSKIGYTGSYASIGSVNSLFERFDDANQGLDKKLSGINMVHGLEIGGRYSVNDFSFELGLTVANGNARAAGTVDGMQEEFRWKASLYDYHLNLVQQFGLVGMGVGLVNQRVTMKQFSRVADEFIEVSKESNLGLNLFLNFEVPSSKVSLAVRPYYRMSFDSFDFGAVADKLQVPDTDDRGLRMIGVSIIFFNGPQR